MGVYVAGSDRLTTGRQDLGPVDSVEYAAVLQELLIRQALDVVAVHPRLDEGIRVLAKTRVRLRQPVSHIVWVACGVVSVGL